MALIQGTAVRMQINDEKVLYAKTSNLDISLSTTEVANKDVGDGDWSDVEADKLSFSGGVEADLGDDTTINSEARVNYDDLFALMIAKTPVSIRFGTNSSGKNDVVGSALITNLSQSAADGELGQISLQITGKGALSLDAVA